MIYTVDNFTFIKREKLFTALLLSSYLSNAHKWLICFEIVDHWLPDPSSLDNGNMLNCSLFFLIISHFIIRRDSEREFGHLPKSAHLLTSLSLSRARKRWIYEGECYIAAQWVKNDQEIDAYITVLGNLLVRSLISSYCSFIYLLRAACFAHELRYAHSFARSRAHEKKRFLCWNWMRQIQIFSTFSALKPDHRQRWWEKHNDSEKRIRMIALLDIYASQSN